MILVAGEPFVAKNGEAIAVSPGEGMKTDPLPSSRREGTKIAQDGA